MTVHLVRRPGWRSRLEAFIDEVKLQPFAWGAFDCGVAWAGKAVLVLTGEDIAAPYRGKYRTADQALKVMRKAGFDNLGDLAASHLPEIHPSQARVGDIAAFPMDSAFGFALGLVNGERVLVVREDGVGSVGLLECTRAFRVG